MSEFRIDPISGDYTIIASERVNRPQDFTKNEEATESAVCPFCYGNEHMTPKSIMEIKDDEGNWCIRVIPNKYPFISNEKQDIENNSFYKNIIAYGVHDVLIDTRIHDETTINFSKQHMKDVFLALQTMQKTREKDPNIEYVQIFKNQGESAGASKSHSHWQIVGLPIVTQRQLKLIEGNKKYIADKGICGYCDIIKYELECKDRLVAENENFVAIAPYASKFPYEVWILPRTHRESFSSAEHIEDLAELFQETVRALNGIFPHIDFNVFFENAPIRLEGADIHHWYLQIIPRITGLAGFEFATDCYINIYKPELVACNLRKIIEFSKK